MLTVLTRQREATQGKNSGVATSLHRDLLDKERPPREEQWSSHVLTVLTCFSHKKKAKEMEKDTET